MQRSLILMLVMALPAAAQDKKPVHPRVTAEILDDVFKSLKLEPRKEEDKNKVQAYVFQRGDRDVRVINYAGDDLWIESVFKTELTPDQANQWNARAKYTRCVLLQDGDKNTVSLEAQLDCVAGVTEGMVRQFLVRFGNELKDFQTFIDR